MSTNGEIDVEIENAGAFKAWVTRVVQRVERPTLILQSPFEAWKACAELKNRQIEELKKEIEELKQEITSLRIKRGGKYV